MLAARSSGIYSWKPAETVAVRMLANDGDMMDWRKRQESNLPRTPTRPPTGLKPARPTGSGTLPSRRIAGFFRVVNDGGTAVFHFRPQGFPKLSAIRSPLIG